MLILWLLAAASAHANVWQDNFVGFLRPALQDTLPSHDDPFSNAAFPSWCEEGGVDSGALYFRNDASLGGRASEAESSNVAAIAGRLLPLDGLCFSAHASLPMSPGALVDSGSFTGPLSPWTPRASRIHAQPAVAMRIWQGDLGFGVALPIVFDYTTDASFNFVESNSTMRVKTRASPDASVVAGLDYTGFDSWRLSLAYSEKKDSDLFVTLRGNVGSGVIQIPFDVLGEAVPSFDPRRVSLQASYDVNPGLTVGALVRYSQWSQGKTPVLLMTFRQPAYTAQTVVHEPKDTIEAAVGSLWKLSSAWQIAGSYRYLPTPYPESSLFYDSAHHVIGVGAMGNFLYSKLVVSLAGQVDILQAGGLYSSVFLGLGYSP